MGFVLLAVVGLAAGFLATRAMRLNADVGTKLAIGVAGALVGALVGAVVIRLVAELAGWALGFGGAVLGAMLLIWLWPTYLRR